MKRKKLPDSVSKRDLWRYVNIKIKRVIHHYHVSSVISILFEEMTKDLLDGKIIKIGNFGKLVLRPTPPKSYFHITERKRLWSPGYKMLKFDMTPKLKRIIRKALAPLTPKQK